VISRSTFQRSCLLAATLALSVALFYFGKGHTVFVDNYTITLAGQELKAVETVSVCVDGGEGEEMGKAERVQRTVAGPSHRVSVEVISGAGQGTKLEKRFSVPLSWDAVVISVPAILAGQAHETFTMKYTAPPREEAPVEKTVQQADSDIIQLPAASPPAAPQVVKP
jgi:hypothetical protein